LQNFFSIYILLEVFRNGIDDFDYLFMLRELLKKSSKNKNEAAYRDAQKLLNIGESFLIKYPKAVQPTLENTIRYPDEPERILQLREKIADAIEQLKKVSGV
jgi:hypothetical protein